MPIGRSENMRRIRSKNTAPEVAVRRMLRALGLRGYRLHRKDLPGKPDIAFVAKRRNAEPFLFMGVSGTATLVRRVSVGRDRILATGYPRSTEIACVMRNIADHCVVEDGLCL